jgi:uncharacterized protein (TIGR00288 family)
MEKSKIAVFIDAENVTQWLKSGGPEKLLSELSATGQIIVRRSYGKWSEENLQGFQRELNRQGFELVHSFHPVSGKNSVDIQMTVDVMEYALRLNDVSWFVLVTGDSDFSPLFRKLREMGKEVVGVGPRSTLSECVKTSCSRFIYTDAAEPVVKEVIDSNLDDAIDLAEKALKTFDGPASCSALKNNMINMDSAFDEKALGFKSFTEFLRFDDSIDVYNESGSNIWYARFKEDQRETAAKGKPGAGEDIPLQDLYRRLLRKKGWRTIPKNALLNIHASMSKQRAMSRLNLLEAVLEDVDGSTTSTDVNKAFTIIRKSNLFLIEDQQDDKFFKIIGCDDLVQQIDESLLIRLLSGIKDAECELNHEALKGFLYGEYSDAEMKTLVSSAEKSIQTN